MPKKIDYAKNKDKYRAESRAYYHENKEALLAKRRHPRELLTDEEKKRRRNAYNRKWVKKNIGRLSKLSWSKHLKRKYGITVEEYEFMESAQAGRCAICRRNPDNMRQRLNVDHCHKTGAIRGLLCWDCNIGISKFNDNYETIERASIYVRSHSHHRVS